MIIEWGQKELCLLKISVYLRSDPNWPVLKWVVKYTRYRGYWYFVNKMNYYRNDIYERSVKWWIESYLFSYPIQSILIRYGRRSFIRFDPLEAGTVLFQMRCAFSNLFISWIMCRDERKNWQEEGKDSVFFIVRK